MGQHPLLQKTETEQMKKEVPAFEIGDTVKVSTKIVEGDKERIQVFQGTVIAIKGSGISTTFSLHRVAYGEGMERVFCFHSPKVTKIEVIRKGKVRRSKLYYLRGTSGKAAKVKERIVAKTTKNKERKVVAEKKEASDEDRPSRELENTTSAGN